MSGRARDLDDVDQVIEQVRALARFPSENPNPVLRLTGTGRVLYANAAAKRIGGLLVGRGKDQLAKRLAVTAAKAAESHKRQNVEFEAGDRAYAFVLAPVAGESYINLYGRDITEEREAARQVEDLAKFPSENTAPIFRIDKDGALIYANEATLRVKGLVIGRRKDRVYKDLARVAEKVFRKKKRKIVEFPSEGRVFALAVTPVSRRHYLNVYGRDITAEKKAKQDLIDANEHLEDRVKERTAALRESEAHAARAHAILNDAIESINEGFALFDADDRLLLCNDRYRDLLYPGMQQMVTPGITFEEILRNAIDKGLIHAVGADGGEDVDGWVAARLERHRNPGGPHIQQRSSGFWVQINERKTSDGGIVATYADITELKLREVELAAAHDKAMEASRAKSEFLANMSHELRTPLNATIGYSELMLEEAEDMGHDMYIQDLKKIQMAGKHLLSLINDVLDLSKIEAGKIELFFEDFEIAGMVEEIASTIAPLIEKNGNTLVVNCAKDLGVMHSDVTRIRQVLLNLLSNASKFTEGGKVTIEAARSATNGRDDIVIKVVDEGIGMSAEQVEKVFEAFTQADSSTTRNYGGTGLGLAITKTFCEMLHGEITCVSAPDKGSTFTVRLPADAAGMAASVAADAPTEIVGPAGAQTVLVIDDDPNVRDLLSRHLNKSGYRVATSSAGPDGLKRAREIQPDAITLDVLMPGMDGWAVLTALKDDEALSDIPVIMVSMLDDRSLGYSLGAADYLTKPVEHARLLAVLRKHCPTKGSGQVLIVEDDTATREMIRRMLNKAGWRTVEAENGLVGLERLAEEAPAAILLDLMMPEMDGFEFLARLRNKKAWRSIPVIVVTAKTLTAADHKRLRGSVEMLVAKSGDEIGTILAGLKKMLPAPPARAGK